MLYFDNRPQMQKYINEHTIEQSPEVIKTHKNQKYILIGTTTEKHGNFWKFSRLLKIIMLAIPSLCSKKLKENFSISIAEFKSGKSKLSIYALEKILDKKPLENQTQPDIQKNPAINSLIAQHPPENPVESSINQPKSPVTSPVKPIEIDEHKLQDKNYINEKIDEIGKLSNLEERKVKLGQLFSKLERSQVLEYLERYESQIKKIPEKFIVDRKSISDMENVLNSQKELQEKLKKSKITNKGSLRDTNWQMTMEGPQDEKRKFGGNLTDESIQNAKSSLQRSFEHSYQEYEDLYTARENAYLNVILGCQVIKVEVLYGSFKMEDESAKYVYECLKHIYVNSSVAIDKYSQLFNEAETTCYQRIKRELG